MAKLGKKPVPIPDKVQVDVKDGAVTVKGPLGSLSWKLPQGIQAKVDGPLVRVTCPSEEKFQKALHGTSRSTIANMIVGVFQGYEKSMDITGVGYSAKIQGQELVLTLGYSHPIHLAIPQELQVTCPSATRVTVKGMDKQKVGQFSSVVRAQREVEPYNLKGIKYSNEVVKKKAGKTFVSGT